MPTSVTSRLLIVDDDPAQLNMLESLDLAGYTTCCFTSATAAMTALREQAYDLVLTGLHLPEMDGITFLRAAREVDPDLVGIIMIGLDAPECDRQRMASDARDYIEKPFTRGAIVPVIIRALAVRRLRLENIHLQQAIGIYELSMVIQLTLDRDAVLQKVADAAMGHTQVGGVLVLLPVEDGKVLSAAVSRGDYPDRDERKSIPLDATVSDWVERSLQRVSHLNELVDMESPLPLEISQLPGSTSVAMLSGGRFVGILNYHSKNPGRPISFEQIKAMNILAGAAASSLQSAALLEQLRFAEQRYRHLADRASDIIIRYELHPKPHVTYVNRAFASVMGHSPEEYYADPELILNIVHPEDRHLKEAVLRDDFVSGSTVTLRCINEKGATVWIEQRNTRVEDADGRLVAVEGIARDVTDRRKLELQVQQLQRMEAVGILAGGLAHDFNNLLTVILGYSDLVLGDGTLTASASERIGEVKKAAELASVLTGQLLTLGRKQVIRRRVLDVNALVENISPMLRQTMGENIELITTLDTAQASIKADPGHIEQILMNLVVNAKYAMPLGGKIAIETQNRKVQNEQRMVNGLAAKPGSYVMFSVSDTGCGMDAFTRARIFEPYFTTKGRGKGTGLGLSVVYGIVKENGGYIQVVSEPQQGTRFEIFLPCVDELQEVRGVPAALPETHQGAQTILIVEDNAEVRQLISAVLQRQGYGVLIARDGNEALCICKENKTEIDLILTDIIMPGMGGPQLLESLRELDRGTRVLYMSGGAGDETADESGFDLDRIPLIQKPFTTAELICKVREVLNSGAAEINSGLRGENTHPDSRARDGLWALSGRTQAARAVNPQKSVRAQVIEDQKT